VCAAIDPAKQPATVAWLALKLGEKKVIEKGVYSVKGYSSRRSGDRFWIGNSLPGP
jgi:hypothetical protein